MSVDVGKKSGMFLLFQILTPFLLRRLKSDVTLEVPPKKEIVVYAPLTAKQEAFYTAVVNKTITKMLGQEKVTPWIPLWWDVVSVSLSHLILEDLKIDKKWLFSSLVCLFFPDWGSFSVDTRWQTQASQSKSSGLHRGHAIQPGEISGEGPQGAGAEVVYMFGRHLLYTSSTNNPPSQRGGYLI